MRRNNYVGVGVGKRYLTSIKEGNLFHLPPHHHPSSKGIKKNGRDWVSFLAGQNAFALDCECGCGEKVVATSKKRWDYPRRYLPGHNNRRAMVTDFTSHEISIILGCLLGDYSIGRPHANASPRLSFTHGEVQKEYALHKIEALSRLGWFWRVIDSEGYKKDGKLVVGSCSCMPSFGMFFDLTRPNSGPKTITLEWLSRIDSVALAYWFMDDGSTNKGQHASFHTEGFSVQENEMIAGWFRSKGYENTRVAFSDGYPYIYLPKADSNRLHSVIDPYIHESMAYKKLGA